MHFTFAKYFGLEFFIKNKVAVFIKYYKWISPIVFFRRDYFGKLTKRQVWSSGIRLEIVKQNPLLVKKEILQSADKIVHDSFQGLSWAFGPKLRPQRKAGCSRS